MTANPLVYRWLSTLLCYPEADMLDALPEFQTALNEWSELAVERADLQALSDYPKRHSLYELQEDCVLVFDHSRWHALYIFKHIYGEDRDRGSAMVDLLEKYHRYDSEPGDDKLLDYLPTLLEFLSRAPPADAQRLLGGAVHVIAHITENLQSYGSPYVAVLKTATALSPVTPQPLTEPPVCDMDETMETFGLDRQGIELLLKPLVQTVRFHPKGRY